MKPLTLALLIAVALTDVILAQHESLERLNPSAEEGLGRVSRFRRG